METLIGLPDECRLRGYSEQDIAFISVASQKTALRCIGAASGKYFWQLNTSDLMRSLQVSEWASFSVELMFKALTIPVINCRHRWPAFYRKAMQRILRSLEDRMHGTTPTRPAIYTERIIADLSNLSTIRDCYCSNHVWLNSCLPDRARQLVDDSEVNREWRDFSYKSLFGELSTLSFEELEGRYERFFFDAGGRVRSICSFYLNLHVAQRSPGSLWIAPPHGLCAIRPQQSLGACCSPRRCAVTVRQTLFNCVRHPLLANRQRR